MYRVLARPKELIPPNCGDIFHLNTVLGYRSSMLISYFDLLSRDWSLSSQALDQIGARYVVTDKSSEGLTLFRLLITCCFTNVPRRALFFVGVVAQTKRHRRPLVS